jgi:signal transduction histidine kinase
VTARTFAQGDDIQKEVMLRDVSIRQHAIEEQRLVRDRLEEAQRLDAVGRLAGGIAHDFRNLLTVVSNSAELIREDTEGEAKRLAEDIREAAERASSLTGQLLAFARREIVRIEAVDIREVIHFMEVGIRQVLGADVELKLMLDGEVPKVYADRSQLEQILFNLARNAADALGGEGSLEISVVGPGGSSKGRIGTYREVPSGFVEIRVSDDGPGMDAEVLERVFEPFFTTKPTGEGTGLGLSTVHGIVSQNGGQVGIESRIGEGTSVQVLWPLGRHRPTPLGS